MDTIRLHGGRVTTFLVICWGSVLAVVLIMLAVDALAPLLFGE